MTERGPEHSDAHATYVFAVCRNPDPSAFVGLPGVADEAPVSILPLETLTAIVQKVRARDFTDEAWQARLSDQRELERYARAHHDVVTAAAACCPTVPLPLATLYHDEQRAADALTNEADRFHAALRRIAHHAEWGVKVYAPPCPPDDSSRRAAPAERSRPAPGAGLAYLERKRGVQERRDQSQDEALQVAETVDSEVRLLATASRRLRPHAPQLSGERRIQVLNATYLVAEQRADELALLTRSLRARTGVEIELSGPWVPYSFIGEV
ncbi:GvpL/GvpF family gas vesicle protein [Streptomyces sp. NBC_01003]|uniref:GvpL/GvpF family gas vesicle protein n=1 Tax=Streptomyces sp. NBC_01003 TaxID=2903714 RepID=UPI003867EDCC|nr:GvpL/GvpF family gas vesicle protein [Streptomyces sp. NBC_01003]